MKYHYEQPDVAVPVYGQLYSFYGSHPIYQYGTLFEQDGKGLVVVQQHFISLPEEESDNVLQKQRFNKLCYWGAVDTAVANDIYLSPYFPKFFATFAKEKDYNVYQLRKLMWSLRMKPLPREPWEDYFGTT